MSADGDVTDANREAWNSRAQTYDTEPYMQKINTQVVKALRERLDWIGAAWRGSDRDECKLLDYACGTGKATMALQPYITSATGLDIAQSMIDVYNARMIEFTATSSAPNTFHASAHLADFCSKEVQLPSNDIELDNFDIAAVVLGFHHFDNPSLCIRRLAERVKKGTGVVLILDWMPSTGAHDHGEHVHGHGEHAHGHGDKKVGDEWQVMQKTIKHHGFDEATMREMYEGVGLTDFKFEVLEEDFVLEPKGRRMVKRGFLARGRRV